MSEAELERLALLSEELAEKENLIREVIQYVKNEACTKSLDEISEVDAIKYFNKQYP